MLLGLLALIIAPTVDKVLKASRAMADKKFQENIVLAAKNWASDNKESLPKDGLSIWRPTLEMLQDNGYVDNNLKRPSTGEDIIEICVKIKIIK